MTRRLLHLAAALAFFALTAAPDCGSNVSSLLNSPAAKPKCPPPDPADVEGPVVTCVYFVACTRDEQCITMPTPDTACQSFPICGTGGFCCPKAGAPCNKASDCCPGLSCKLHKCSDLPEAPGDTGLPPDPACADGGAGGNGTCNIPTKLYLHCPAKANSSKCSLARELKENLDVPAAIATGGGSFNFNGEMWTVKNDCSMTVTVDYGSCNPAYGTWDPAAGTGTLTTPCPEDCKTTTQQCTITKR